MDTGVDKESIVRKNGIEWMEIIISPCVVLHLLFEYCSNEVTATRVRCLFCVILPSDPHRTTRTNSMRTAGNR